MRGKKREEEEEACTTSSLLLIPIPAQKYVTNSLQIEAIQQDCIAHPVWVSSQL